MTSLRMDEEEEAELARVGARLGLPSGAWCSLPAPESRRTGADETCPRVCMMKPSCSPLPSRPRAVLTRFCPSPLLFHPLPPLLPKLLENRRRFWRSAETHGWGRTRAGGSAASSPASVGATCLFSQAAVPPPASTARSEVRSCLIQNIQC